MARITAPVLAQLPDGPALLDFIGRYRYTPENAALLHPPTFALLPDYAQHVILMLDFETEYEMQGLYTLLENALSQQLPAIAHSFKQTKNEEIATCLQQVLTIQAAARAQPTAEATEWRMPNTLLQLDQVDEHLRPLILAKAYWDNVLAFIELRLSQRGH